MSRSADHAAEALQAILAAISTNDLIGELVSREGVAVHRVFCGERYQIQKCNKCGTLPLENHTGPVRIITVDGE